MNNSHPKFNENYTTAIAKDKACCWHPFTRQDEWTSDDHSPVMIESGQGAWLTDLQGNEYIDGNASIWTNIHGHNHPALNEAITEQLGKVAHSSYLGFGHKLASDLAEKLVSFFPDSDLQRVFYSDDGSTAVECAMKMALQYRIQNGEEERVEFVAFDNGYHGDTLGAASLGGLEAFFSRFRKFGVTVHFVKSVDEFHSLNANKIAAVIIEPLVQGVNQINVWKSGMLRELRNWTSAKQCHLILDEVMTGFGRTGSMFACQQEEVVPDFLCLAKGLTGGYMPMAATLVTETIYDGFLGDASRAFYYGHSYTANPLGCAVALASLDVFEKENTLVGVREKSAYLAERLSLLKQNNPNIHEIRRVGLVTGIEIRHADGNAYEKAERMGEKVCEVARKYQLLTRPILDTIVFLPPLCITRDEMNIALTAIDQAVRDVCG